MKHLIYLLISFFFVNGYTQKIKTIQLKTANDIKQKNVFVLGEVIELSFDDLENQENQYQYKIEHMTYDWKKSNILPNQYINGFQQNYINSITNSFNTLQDYIHYSVKIPNENTVITKTGNYLISVLDEDDQVIFSRKCVFYENKTAVGVAVSRSKTNKHFNTAQNIQTNISYKNFRINNPEQEIKIAIIQNRNWKTIKYNNIPQFYKNNQLIYSYLNQNNFNGANEFRNFDSKNIRSSSAYIAKSELKEVYHNYLFTDQPRVKKNYGYNPDTNGQFVIRTLDSNFPNTEADYAIMHFSLEAKDTFKDQNIHIIGGFNNYELSEHNKMSFNHKKNIFELNLKLKQGFYDYSYICVDNQGKENNILVDGNFFETENQYTVIVYYRPYGSIYDQVIGIGNAIFNPNQ